jgi:hypothetical protein
MRTIEDSFEYNIKRIILTVLRDEPKELWHEEYLWKKKKELGEAFFERVGSYMGVQEAIHSILEEGDDEEEE